MSLHTQVFKYSFFFFTSHTQCICTLSSVTNIGYVLKLGNDSEYRAGQILIPFCQQHSSQSVYSVSGHCYTASTQHIHKYNMDKQVYSFNTSIYLHVVSLVFAYTVQGSQKRVNLQKCVHNQSVVTKVVLLMFESKCHIFIQIVD